MKRLKDWKQHTGNKKTEAYRKNVISLINSAGNKDRWNYDGAKDVDNYEFTQKDWNQTLMTKINQAVASLGMRGDGDAQICLLVSSEIFVIIDDFEFFFITDEEINGGDGAEKIGSLGSSLPIYRDKYLPAEIMLVCFEDDLNGGELSEDAQSITIFVDNLIKY